MARHNLDITYQDQIQEYLEALGFPNPPSWNVTNVEFSQTGGYQEPVSATVRIEFFCEYDPSKVDKKGKGFPWSVRNNKVPRDHGPELQDDREFLKDRYAKAQSEIERLKKALKTSEDIAVEATNQLRLFERGLDGFRDNTTEKVPAKRPPKRG